MKVIVSHDVDHLSVTEHVFADLYIPKLILRNHLELFSRSINLEEYILRWRSIFANKIHHIEELVKFDKQNNIPSTFFFGVNNGKSLNYSINEAKKWIEYVERNGLATGVHGINFKKLDIMKNEFDKFKLITFKKIIGIRMHYLRHDHETHKKLSSIGYSYDASVFNKKLPFVNNGILCFPTHIIDAYEVYNGQKWLRNSFEKIKENTKLKIDNFIEHEIDFLSILSHDT